MCLGKPQVAAGQLTARIARHNRRAAYIQISQNFHMTLENRFGSSLAYAEKRFWSSPVFVFKAVTSSNNG